MTTGGTSASPRYRIGAVSRMTGLPADVIRMWERRYSVVTPFRDENGVRVYGDADVERLQHLGRATQAGHSIGLVAAMSAEELDRLMSRAAQEPSGDVAQNAVARIIEALRTGELYETDIALMSAAMLLDAQSLALDVLAPALRQAGRLWEEGSLQIWQEHLLSHFVRTVIGSLLRSLPRHDPRALLFVTPPFEQHEFGIAIAAVLAAARGRPTHILGTNVPVLQAVQATRRADPSCVLVGVTRESAPVDEAVAYIKALEHGLPAKTAIWLGGPLSAVIIDALGQSRAQAITTLEQFDQRLRTDPRATAATALNDR